ncbi:MAG: hypothetical protein V3T07_08875, partial [Myxococcota bacterium]
VWIKDAMLETPGAFDRGMIIWQANDQVVSGLRGEQFGFTVGVPPGALAETRFFAVQVATGDIPARGTVAGRTDWAIEVGQVIPLNLFIPRGMRVFLANIQAAELDTLVYTWREVPSRNRDGDGA